MELLKTPNTAITALEGQKERGFPCEQEPEEWLDSLRTIWSEMHVDPHVQLPDPDNPEPIYYSPHPDGTIKVTGISQKELAGAYTILRSYDERYLQDVPATERKRRIANALGILVQEAQTFTDGNKRTGRVTFASVLEDNAETVTELADTQICFNPSVWLEEKILTQNTAQLRAWNNKEPNLTTEQSLSQAHSLHSSILALAPADLQLSSRLRSSPSACFYARITELYHALNKPNDFVHIADDTPNREEILNRLSYILLQREYGPAALAVTAVKPDKIIDAKKAGDIISSHADLLRMRAVSLCLAAMKNEWKPIEPTHVNSQPSCAITAQE